MATSMKILKTKQLLYFYYSLPVFTVVMVILVWTHYNYGDYKKNMRTVNFILK